MVTGYDKALEARAKAEAQQYRRHLDEWSAGRREEEFSLGLSLAHAYLARRLVRVGGITFEEAARRVLQDAEEARLRGPRAPERPTCASCGDAGWVRGEMYEDAVTGTIYPMRRCPSCGPAPKGVGPSDMRMDTFRATTPVLKRALDVAKSFVEAGEPPWVVFVGPLGAGKTHLAVAMGRARQERGESVRLVRCSDLLNEIWAADLQDRRQLVEGFRRIPVLILDELGKESHSAGSREVLESVLNARYFERSRTIITSNLSLEELEQVSPSLASRMGDASVCALVSLAGAEDYRKKK